MNILSSPLWPSDMPDDRRLIAVLGLVQILEEGMEYEPIENFEEGQWWLLELDALKGDDQKRAVAVVRNLMRSAKHSVEEIERLNALVAMHHNALTALTEEFRTGAGGSRNFSMAMRKEIITNALSATAETVSAWLSKRDTEILAKTLEDAADWFVKYGPPDTPIETDDVAARELRRMASELRAKGE